MNDRIKFLRKELKLNQQDFGSKLGVTSAAISRIEKGERNVTDQMIKAICREFNVDYFWLTKGQGEPFVEVPDTILDEMQQEYELSDMQRKIVEEFLKLSKDERNTLEKYITNILRSKTISGGEVIE